MQCRWLCLLLLMLLSLPARAVVLEAAAGRHAAVNLSGHLSARCVAAADETIASVAAPDRAHEFVAIPGPLIKSYVRDTCWLRFQVQRAADAPTDWQLEVGTPYLDDVALYLHPASALPTAPLRLGDRQAFADRPVPFRHFVFPIHLADTKPVTAYLRVQTTSTMVVDPVRLWQPVGLEIKGQSDSALHWFVYGLIALGLVSNLLFWVWLRESVYVIYSGYLLGMLVTSLSNSGYMAQWVLPQWPLVADRLFHAAIAVTYAIGLLLFRNIFDFRRRFPLAERLVPAFLVFYATCATASAAGHFFEVAFWQQLAGLTVIVGVSLVGPWLLWRGQRQLKLYVIAFSIQLLIVFVVTLRNLGLWPLDLPLNYFILVSTGVHVVLLNIALAQRMQQTHREQVRLGEEAARLESQQTLVTEQKEFVGMVAHEFGTPLAIIDTCAQQLTNKPHGAQDDAALNQQRCADIRDAVKRMNALIEQFLVFDRMDGEMRKFRALPWRLADLVAELRDHFPNPRLVVDTAAAPVMVHADPALLNLALGNLIANALRYSPDDQPVRLIVSSDPAGGTVFTVEDHGPGVAPDEIANIFQKYKRGRAMTTKTGAGLGLYIVERIARMHAGQITVENLPWQGARFTLALPPPLAASFAQVHSATAEENALR